MNSDNKQILKETNIHSAKISYTYYCTAFSDSVALEKRWEKLKNAVKNTFSIYYFDDIQTDIKTGKELSRIHLAQSFLHGDGMPFEVKRVFINDFALKHPLVNIVDDNIILTYFPEVNLLQFSINLKIEDVSLSSLVYLRQVFCNNPVFMLAQDDEHAVLAGKQSNKANPEQNTWYNIMKNAERDENIQVSTDGMFESVMKRLGIIAQDVEKSFIAELNDFEACKTSIEVEETFGGAIYGIITGDEGWMYAPESLVKERLSNQWGSRVFMRVYSFGIGTVLINLNQSFVSQDYLQRQDCFGTMYYGGMNPYFLLDSSIAGVCHGILFSVETIMVIKTISNRIYAKQSVMNNTSKNGKHSSYNLKKTNEYRVELMALLRRVETISISEIGELENMMLQSHQVTPLLDKLKYLLELTDSQLDLLYQTSTNRLINILTVAGLALSIGSLIFDCLSFLLM